MAEKYGFFNDVDGDREYRDDALAEPFGAIVGSAGVVIGFEDELTSQTGTGLEVKTNAGFAFGGQPSGWWYRATSRVTKALDPAGATNNRIDIVIIRFDRNTSVRSAAIEVLKGEETALTPTPPVLTQDETIYELPLCEVHVFESTLTSITDARTFASISKSTEMLGIKSIDADSGVVAGDFIYFDNGVWKIDNTTEQDKGTHIYNGKDAVLQGQMAYSSSASDVGYSLYVQSNGKLETTLSDTVAALVLSTTKLFINFSPVNVNTKP